MKRSERRRLSKLLKAYADSYVDDAFKGAKHPKDWPEIDANLVRDEGRLWNYLDELIPADRQTKIRLEALGIAAEQAYQSEIVNTEMEDQLVGPDRDYNSKEEWKELRIESWLDEAETL